ncbi:MAG TPA: hypothetical protein DCK95_00710 [Anaerolineaceae bacterium]|nr:hypothetical protein [Anaerolineaceae bacterium]
MKTKTVLGIILAAALLASCNVTQNLNSAQNASPQTSELKAQPTESVLSEDVIILDEFEGNINDDWGMMTVSGLEDQLIWSQSNGKFRLEIQPPNDTNFVFFRKNASYKDIVVQAEVENYGQSDNATSVMCHASDAGWYELRISSQGYYELLRYDQYLADEGKNAYTSFIEGRIGSTLINTGLDKNTFALSCTDNQLTVFINGEQVYKDKRPLVVEDNTYPDGTVGFGALSYGKEVDITFNYFETLKP